MRTIALTWETAHRHGEAWISHHRLRYRMFVERQSWNVPSYRQLEYDQFDTPAATYILVVDDQNRTLGTTRLIPTTRPYMIETLWPDLVDSALPHDPSIWEASRFGCDRDLDAVNRREVVARLIQSCQEFGLLRGIERYLGVMPTWIFKHVIAAHGCPVTFLRSRQEPGGHKIEAAYIDVSPSALDNVRQHTGLKETLIEMNSWSEAVVAPFPLEGELPRKNEKTLSIQQHERAVQS